MRDQRVELVCGTCGTTYLRSPSVAKRSTRHFCSLACAGRKAGKPRTRPAHTCEQCGKQFWPASSRNPGRFCSKACLDAWQRRDRIERPCEVCGLLMSIRPSDDKYAKAGKRPGGVRFCSKQCEGLGRTIRGVGRMHNGKNVLRDASGYLRIWEPEHPDSFDRGWMLEHRYIAGKQLGRRLRRDEQVHHVNGDKTDNRPENLAVLDPTTHTLITVSETGLRRAAAQRRIRDLEAELARYRERFGSLD